MKKIITFLFIFVYATCYSQQHNIDSLKFLLKTAKEDTNKVNILDQISKNCIATGDYDSTLKYAVLENLLAEKLNFPKGKATSLSRQGSFYYAKGHYLKAISYFLSSVKILKQIGDMNSVIKSYNLVGNIYYDMGNYPKAISYQTLSLKISEQINDTEGIGRCYNNIGNVFQMQGNYPEALKNHLNALQIRQQLGDKYGIASSYHNLANVYTFQENHKQALKYYLTALKVFKEVGEVRDVSTCLMEIGATYSKLKNYTEAIKFSSEALQLNTQSGDVRRVGEAYSKLASIYFKLQNYPEALKNNQEALRHAGDIGDQTLKAEASLNTAAIYIELKEYDKAIKYLEEGLSLCKEVGYLEGVKVANDMLSQANEIKGNYKLSLKYFKAFVTTRDSIYNEENTKQMVRSEMNFDFAKKEAVTKLEKRRLADQNQIQLLQLERRNYSLLGLAILLIIIVITAWLVLQQNKLKSQQKAIQLEQKLLRSQMNPHFIFNALASIESFIYENQPKEAGRYLSDFARLMRLILDNSVSEYITLEKEIKTLEYYLSLQKLRLENNLIYTIDVDDHLDPNDVQIPPMLTQPFIENAIEHGFRGSKQTGKVEISFHLQSDNLVVIVKDNGIGINKAAENEKQKKHKSMAMQITKERLAALNKSKKQKLSFSISDISGENSENTGTKVVFSIPL